MSTDGLGDRIEQLEAQVRRLEEERDLRELLARYSFTADLFRGQPWVDLWTDDGVYELSAEERADGHPQRYAGRDELMALITGPGMPPPGRSQHHTQGPLVFRIDGDRAVAEGYSVTYVNRPSGNEVWNMGFSRWTFRRVDGVWKIERRQRREIGSPDQAEMISSH